MILEVLVGSGEDGGVDLEKGLKVFEVKSANVAFGLESRMSKRRNE